MGDPLSAIAGVIGIFGAAVQMSAALHDVVKTIINAPKEIDSFLKDTSDFESVISNIYVALQDPEVQEVISKDCELLRVVSNMIGPVNGCCEIVDQLRAKIEKHIKPTSGMGKCRISSSGVMWYLKKAGVRQSFVRFHSHKTNVDTALTSIIFLCNIRGAGRGLNFGAHRKKDSLTDRFAGYVLREYAESMSSGIASHFGPSNSNVNLEVARREQQDSPIRDTAVQAKETSEQLEGGEQHPPSGRRWKASPSPRSLDFDALMNGETTSISLENYKDAEQKYSGLREKTYLGGNNTALVRDAEFPWLSRYVEESTISASKAARYIFGTRELRVGYGESEQYIQLSPTFVDALTREIALISFICMFLIPAMLLNASQSLYIRSRAEANWAAYLQLIIILGFTLLISVSCALCTTKRFNELLMFTLTYLASLLIFSGRGTITF